MTLTVLKIKTETVSVCLKISRSSNKRYFAAMLESHEFGFEISLIHTKKIFSNVLLFKFSVHEVLQYIIMSFYYNLVWFLMFFSFPQKCVGNSSSNHAQEDAKTSENCLRKGNVTELQQRIVYLEKKVCILLWNLYYCMI